MRLRLRGKTSGRDKKTTKRLRELVLSARTRAVPGNLRSTPQCKRGSLTKEQRVAVGVLVSRGVTDRTRKGYEGHWGKWVAFLLTIPEWQRPSKFLSEVTCPSDKVDWLSLFVLYLYDVHGLRGARRVSAVLSGLRLIWRVQRLDNSFFDHPDLLAAKKGVRPTVAEVRNNEIRKAETRKLPAIVEIMWVMRERLWVDTELDARGLYLKAIWIAAITGFDTGVRSSNVRLKDGRTAVDHCILASDLSFSVMTALGIRRFQGGEAIRKELEEDYPESVQRVLDVDVSIVTTIFLQKPQLLVT